MPKIRINTKSLKSTLKVFSTFADQHSMASPIITLAVDPSFRMVFCSDSTIVCATPESEVVESTGSVSYSCDSSTLLGMSLNGSHAVLGWEDIRSPLSVECGAFRGNLKIAVKQPDFPSSPASSLENTQKIPCGILSFISNYLALPMSYFKGKKDLLPVKIFSKQGFLTAGVDDGYSLAEVSTSIPVPEGFDFKVPYYALESQFGDYSLEPGEEATVGCHGFSIYMKDKLLAVLTSGMNDQPLDFDTVFSEQKVWLTSCKFNPAELVAVLKPLMSVLPAKDTGTIIRATFGKCLQLSMQHPTIGDAFVDSVPGVGEIFNEKSMNALVYMHPKAFFDYSTLVSGFKEAQMMASSNAVFYEIRTKLGDIDIKLRYLFPTVQIGE